MRIAIARRRVAVFLVILGYLLYAFRPAFIVPLCFPFHSDAGKEFNYSYYAVNALVQTGTYPLWNPYNNCGEPFYYNHCWQGVLNPLLVPVAWLAGLSPRTSLSHCLLLILLVAIALLAWMFHAYCLKMIGHRGAAVVATCYFTVCAADLVNSVDECWTVLGYVPIFLFLELWWGRLQSRYVWAAAVAAGIYATRANVCLTDSLLVIVAYLAVRLPGVLRERGRSLLRACLSRHAIGAAALLALLLAPKLLIAAEAASGVYRLGSSVPAPAGYDAPRWASGLQLVSVATDAELLNALIIFVPFSILDRRSRPFFLLLFLTLIPVGVPAVYDRFWSFLFPRLAATGHLADLYVFERATYLFLIILGAFGLRALLRAGVPRGGFLGAIVRFLCLLLWGGMLFRLHTPATLLPGLLYLVLLWPRPHSAARIATGRAAWYPLAISVPLLLFTIPAAYYFPVPEYKWLTATPYGHPGPRTTLGFASPPELLGISELLSRPTVTQELSVYGTKWRTRRFHEALQRLEPWRRGEVVRDQKPVLYLAASLSFAASDEELWSLLNGSDTPDAAVLSAADREALPPGLRSPPEGLVPQVVDFSPDRLTARVASPFPTLLVYADGYHPRWQAEVNGHSVRILPVNGLGKGVVVPAGLSSIRFSFRYPLLSCLLWLSTALQLAAVPLLMLLVAGPLPRSTAAP